MNECKRWHGAHREDGRPTLGGRYVYRIAWEIEHGALPLGMVLHHSCEHPWCINHEHLELMSQSEHMKLHGFFDGDVVQAEKTHCPQGHPYDDANTYHYRKVDKRTGITYHERQCRTCRRERSRARRAN